MRSRRRRRRRSRPLGAFADGQPDPITAVLAQLPELFDVALPFIGATLGPSFVLLRAGVDAIALGPNPVDTATATAMTSHWEDAAVVEITVLIGTTMMLNRLGTGLALPLGAETLVRLAAEGFAA